MTSELYKHASSSSSIADQAHGVWPQHLYAAVWLILRQEALHG